ncbi:anti-sigma factor antagonist [Nibrella saemangeumensis]|uniref:Anti-sigma factor antagonist n=1 Tax=Nibrella saemangeumensis TaxID=1084526 RepID=A0ABP8NGB7_9BACT
MEVTVKSEEGITVIEAAGNIDSKTAPEFQNSAVSAAEGKDKIIIDLTKVEFLSSAGLRVLLMIYRQIKANNGQVVLVGTSEDIQDVMANTGFLNFFILAENLEEGIQAFKEV